MTTKLKCPAAIVLLAGAAQPNTAGNPYAYGLTRTFAPRQQSYQSNLGIAGFTNFDMHLSLTVINAASGQINSVEFFDPAFTDISLLLKLTRSVFTAITAITATRNWSCFPVMTWQPIPALVS